MKLEILILDLEYSNQSVPIKEEFQVVYNWENLSRDELQNALLISSKELKIQEASNHEIAVLGLETVKKDTFLPCTYVIEDLFSLNKQEAERIYAREKNIPVVVMETERLIIREMSAKDVDLLYHLYEDPQNTHYVEPLFSDREEEIAYINDYSRMIYRFYDLGMWLLFHKETGELIGRAGVEPMNHEGEIVLELGYLIGRKWQRQGYATESCKGILEYVCQLEQYPYVDALIELENTESIGFIQALGFEKLKSDRIGKKPMERWRKILLFQ